MNRSLESIYTEHHRLNRQRGFTLLESERGHLLQDHIGTGKTVLDIGCRDGALTKSFIKGNKVLGIDIDPVALSEAKNLGIDTLPIDLNGDWHELNGRKFDAVVAGEVLEHLYHPAKVTGRVASLLSDDGKFLGSVPNAFSLKNRLRYLFGVKKHTPLSDPTHINQFHIDELRSILENHFKQVDIIGLGRYKRLARIFPGIFGFDLFFIASEMKKPVFDKV